MSHLKWTWLIWRSVKFLQAVGPAVQQEQSWQSVCLEVRHLWAHWCFSGGSGTLWGCSRPARRCMHILNPPIWNKESTKRETTAGSSDAELTALGMGTSSCVPDGARTAKRVWPGERREWKSLHKKTIIYYGLQIFCLYTKQTAAMSAILVMQVPSWSYTAVLILVQLGKYTKSSADSEPIW